MLPSPTRTPRSGYIVVTPVQALQTSVLACFHHLRRSKVSRAAHFDVGEGDWSVSVRNVSERGPPAVPAACPAHPTQGLPRGGPAALSDGGRRTQRKSAADDRLAKRALKSALVPLPLRRLPPASRSKANGVGGVWLPVERFDVGDAAARSRCQWVSGLSFSPPVSLALPSPTGQSASGWASTLPWAPPTSLFDFGHRFSGRRPRVAHVNYGRLRRKQQPERSSIFLASRRTAPDLRAA